MLRLWAFAVLLFAACTRKQTPQWTVVDAGLPTRGQWREGGCWQTTDEGLFFVSPPARKSASVPRRFRWNAQTQRFAPQATTYPEGVRFDYGSAACRGSRVALAMHLTGSWAGQQGATVARTLGSGLPASSSKAVVWLDDDTLATLADLPGHQGLRTFTLVDGAWVERVLDAQAIGEQLTTADLDHDGALELVWLSRRAGAPLGIYWLATSRATTVALGEGTLGTALTARADTLLVATLAVRTKQAALEQLHWQAGAMQRQSLGEQPSPIHALASDDDQWAGVRDDASIITRRGERTFESRGTMHCTARQATFMPGDSKHLLVAYADEDDDAARLGCESEGGLVLYELQMR